MKSSRDSPLSLSLSLQRTGRARAGRLVSLSSLPRRLERESERETRGVKRRHAVPERRAGFATFAHRTGRRLDNHAREREPPTRSRLGRRGALAARSPYLWTTRAFGKARSQHSPLSPLPPPSTPPSVPLPLPPFPPRGPGGVLRRLAPPALVEPTWPLSLPSPSPTPRGVSLSPPSRSRRGKTCLPPCALLPPRAAVVCP